MAWAKSSLASSCNETRTAVVSRRPQAAPPSSYVLSPSARKEPEQGSRGTSEAEAAQKMVTHGPSPQGQERSTDLRTGTERPHPTAADGPADGGDIGCVRASPQDKPLRLQLQTNTPPRVLVGGGCCPQGGTAGVSRTHKGLFCSQGLFTKSALPVCQDHGERAELGQSPECTAWQIYSCLLLAPRQDATWLGTDQCIQVKKAGRGACAGEKHRELSEVCGGGRGG